MLDVSRIRLRIGLPVCVAAHLLLSPGPALAHKMYIFARAQAETVRGKVYFRGNTPAEGVSVEAFDPAGKKVGQARTDAQGEFTLSVRSRGELKLIAVGDDGHAAEPFTLTVSDEVEKPPVVDAGPDRPAAEPSAVGAPAAAEHRPAGVPDQKALQAAVEAAVSRQVAPLQETLAEIQDQITFRDYVGGIGYIMGLMGLAFYFLGVRRRGARSLGRKAENSDPPDRRSPEAGGLEKHGE